nr:MAG TPA: NavMS pore and C-terminal domain PROTEIN, SELECTIVITY FILTER, MEMBRANE [Caudoviricetes sp.]
MYYAKPDYYTIVVGCVCLLTFLAIVFLNPKEMLNKNEATKEEVISLDELKKSLDEISHKLEKIRVELEKQEAREKE